MSAPRKRSAQSDSEEATKRTRNDSDEDGDGDSIQAADYEFDPSDYFELQPSPVHKEKKWKKGVVTEKSFIIKITKDLETTDQERILQLMEILEAAYRDILDQAPPDSLAQLYLSNTDMDKACISSRRAPPAVLTFEHLATKLDDVLDSNESIKLENTTFMLNTFTPPRTVGGRGTSVRSRHEYSKDVWELSKKSMYDPMSNCNRIPHDLRNHCVALVLAKELFAIYNPNVKRSKMGNFLKCRSSWKQAKDLVRQAGLDPDKAPYPVEQLDAFEKCLPEGVGLNFFYDAAPPFLQIGPKTDKSINIFISPQVQEDGSVGCYHAYGISSLGGFFGKEQVCNYCFKCYKYGRKHKCSEAGCRLCKYAECKNIENERKARMTIDCEDCGLYFHTRECYVAHILTCGDKIRCKFCSLSFTKSKLKTHKCATPYCHTCKQEHSPFDFCYVPGAKKKGEKEKKPIKIWYADSETQVDPVTKQHKANLVILQNQDNSKTFEYKGPDAMLQFVQACLPKDNPFAYSVIVFHNASGFDAHLWYKAIWDMGCPPKKIIRKQQKIIGMTTAQHGINCRDSLQYVPGTSLVRCLHSPRPLASNH